MVDVTFGDLQSHFLILPQGSGYIRYPEFQSAYEVLKQKTSAFREFTEEKVWSALIEDSLAFVVLRTILGMSPPEWADLARSERDENVPQNEARNLDTRVRERRKYFAELRERSRRPLSLVRSEAMVSVAVEYISKGAPNSSEGTIHRLGKVDTEKGLESLRHVANEHVPFAVLLYERYLGRPFASHRDAVSELVGDVMENAIEKCLRDAAVTFRKTGRAERVPGFDQAPDFFVPDEFNPKVIVEAKITGDDGTARDKVARILRLAHMRDTRVREGNTGFQVVACIDGRGFGIRRQDMKDMLTATLGKVFTLSTVKHLTFRTSRGRNPAISERVSC